MVKKTKSCQSLAHKEAYQRMSFLFQVDAVWIFILNLHRCRKQLKGRGGQSCLESIDVNL